jgi:probable rRNA maturation factor
MDSIQENSDTDPSKRSSSSRERWRVAVERGFSGARIPRAAISRVLQRVGQGEKARGEIRVVVVDDRQMRQLNRRFRKHDRSTDVLAFPTGPSFPSPVDQGLLGEVYCNFDHARRWKRAHGGSQSAELARLAVHGCLHLLGYRHRTPAQRRAMTAREDRYLADAGLIAMRSSRR